jgi:uncharacterized protein
MLTTPPDLLEFDRRGRDIGAGTVFQYRADPKLAATEGRQLRGYAIVFNRTSQDLGGFVEQVAPEAVQRTLREGADVFSLFNHDWAYVLGRSSAGTMRMMNDPYGLQMVTDPPDPVYPANLIESVRRRDITSMSFGFQTLEDHWDWDQEIPLRTLLDIRLIEGSIVPRPAYLDTTVGVRAFMEIAKHHGRPWRPSMAFRERDQRAKEVQRPR